MYKPKLKLKTLLEWRAELEKADKMYSAVQAQAISSIGTKDDFSEPARTLGVAIATLLGGVDYYIKEYSEDVTIPISPLETQS